jgi:catechol 2,3-dioxygenase-like lactoylglutathione lyase family enzyme
VDAYIRNIVLACPGGTWEEYLKEGRALAEFYAALLGMRIIREDWFKIATDEDSSPQLAFGDGPGEYTPPSWPDPERPQQMHLDIGVRDLDGTEELVLGLGATRLRHAGEHRTYADPAGHPFCLYSDGSGDDRQVGRVVIDCPDPSALAAFYEQLLGMRERVEDSPERVVIANENGSLPMVAFQQVSRYEAPRWPDPAHPQQVHLDIYTDDGKAACELVEGLGATALPPKGGTCPVHADPAGHPFCLCEPGQ